MKRLIGFFLAMLILTGCANQRSVDLSVYDPGDKCLSVWTCLEESVYAPLVKEFEERTGIWVEVKTGSSMELAAALPEGGCDLLLGCEAAFLEANSDLFRQCAAEMRVDLVQGCPEGKNWVPISLNPVVLVYNPMLVRWNPPEDWMDLTEWQGYVAFCDPEKSDFGQTVLRILMEENSDSNAKQVFTNFRSGLKTLFSDRAEAASSVTNGSNYLAALPGDLALRMIREGECLAVIYPQTTYLMVDGGAIPNNAAHPENAEAFLTFLLGEDAQRFARKSGYRGSVRSELTQISEQARFLPMKPSEQLMEIWRQVWEVGNR